MSSVSSYTEFRQIYPFAEIVGISVIEFLLPGSIYSFGILYAKHCENGLYADGLWFTITAFAFWLITKSVTGIISKYLQGFEKTAITLLTFTLLLGKILPLVYTGNFGKFAVQGALEGCATCIILALIKSNRGEYFNEKPNRYFIVCQIARGFGVLMIPLFYHFLIQYYGYSNTQFIYSAVVLNVIPAAYLVVKTDVAKNLDNNEMNIIYRDYSSDDYNDDFWEKNSEKDDSVQPDTAAPIINTRGVEIMPIINEERESTLTLNDMQSKTFDERWDEENSKTCLNIQKVCAKCCTFFSTDAFYVYLMLTTKTSLTLCYGVYFNVISIGNGITLLPLIGSMWMFFILLFSWVISSRNKRYAVYLMGLMATAISTYILAAMEGNDAKATSAFIFGIGYGALAFVEESIFEDVVETNKDSLINLSNFLSGTCVMVIFAIVYGVFELNSNLYYILTIIIILNIIIWSCLPVIKIIYKLKKRNSYVVN